MDDLKWRLADVKNKYNWTTYTLCV